MGLLRHDQDRHRGHGGHGGGGRRPRERGQGLGREPPPRTGLGLDGVGLREPVGPERPRARADRSPLGRGRRVGVGGQVQYLVPELGRDRPEGNEAELQHRPQHLALTPAAHRAALDVRGDLLAQPRAGRTVRAGDQALQVRAGLPPDPGHHQRAERGVQVGTGPGHQPVRVVAGHPEHVGQVGTGQLVPQAELDDLLVIGGQADDRGPHQVQWLDPGVVVDVDGHPARFLAWPLAGLRPAADGGTRSGPPRTARAGAGLDRRVRTPPMRR